MPAPAEEQSKQPLESPRFPPQGYIIGAQKAATTSLASLLAQHPGLTISEPKEPHFFTVGLDRGLNWYRSCFSRSDTFLIDASTSYTLAPVANGPAPPTKEPAAIGVPKRIHELRADARFIYMVRNPAARTYSAYSHSVRAGEESRPLRQAIIEDAYYTNPSYYFAQLSNYLEYFDLDQFLFISFDEFRKNPLASAQKCVAFLDVTPSQFDFQSEQARNESFQYNTFGKALHQIAGNAQLAKLSRSVRDLVPRWSHGLLKKIVARPNPPLSENDRSWLASFFVDDSEKFARLTGVKP